MISHLRPLAVVATPLESSLGKILAEEIIAPIDLPRYSNSAMDGFAVRSEDTVGASVDEPVRFTIVGDLEPGEAWTVPLGHLQTVRISTGAAVPVDCDAVIPVENARERDSVIDVTQPVDHGRNVRLQGEDIRAGTRALASGTRLRPQEIGLVAALGVALIQTIPIPRVGILSIGSELFPSARPAPVFDANGPMLAAQVESAGGHLVRVDRCSGDLPELSDLLHHLGSEVDLIITSGGVSDSNADTMADILATHPDGELWNVRLRPGKHAGAGFFEGSTVISLPGNPIAALVGFELFGRLAIDLLAGRSRDSTRATARAEEAFSGALGRTDAFRGHASIDADGSLAVALTENRGSGILSSLPEANCLILLPESTGRIERGDTVEIRWVGYQ